MMMLRFSLLTSVILFALACQPTPALEPKAPQIFPYCQNFRLDQVAEASAIRDEVIEAALADADWNKVSGKVKGSKSVTGGHNAFVFRILSKSEKLKALLANCPTRLALTAVEKVRVFQIKDLTLSADLNRRAKPTDRVPADAMIFVGPSAL